MGATAGCPVNRLRHCRACLTRTTTLPRPNIDASQSKNTQGGIQDLGFRRGEGQVEPQRRKNRDATGTENGGGQWERVFE